MSLSNHFSSSVSPKSIMIIGLLFKMATLPSRTQQVKIVVNKSIFKQQIHFYSSWLYRHARWWKSRQVPLSVFFLPTDCNQLLILLELLNIK